MDKKVNYLLWLAAINATVITALMILWLLLTILLVVVEL